MAIIRWEPAREISSLQGEVNRLFSTFFDTPAAAAGAAGNGIYRRWVPPMDLVETDEHFVLTADLPGLDRDDVKIEFEDGVLTISGEREHEHTERKGGYSRVERSTGQFSRSVTLPDGIDASKVTATFGKGVLEVRVPKPEARKPHRVEIAVGGEPETIEAATE